MSVTCIVASAADLEICLSIRREVFVAGQKIAADVEFDGEDDRCVHFLAFVDGAPAGTGRLRPKDNSRIKFERIATLENYRRQGVGSALLNAMVVYAKERHPERTCVMHAQVTALTFYMKLGWRPVGPTFEEANILHQAMLYDQK